MVDESDEVILSLLTVPVFESGSNWLNFHRRITEWLILVGLGSTLSRASQPVAPTAPEQLQLLEGQDSYIIEQKSQFAIAQNEYATQKKIYEEKLEIWEESQQRACAAVQNRCGHEQYTLIQGNTRVYDILDVLEGARTTGVEKFFELTWKFYAVSLADYRNVGELARNLSQINHELRDLHQNAAFTDAQLVMRFLLALGPAFELFIIMFQQTHNHIEALDKPAVTFDTVVQKACEEEIRQKNASTGATLFAVQARPNS